MTQTVKAIIEDVTSIEGESFGAFIRRGRGRVQHGHDGYPENLTDPSFADQILVLTTPMVGNYGVPSNEAVREWPLSYVRLSALT